MATPKKDKMDGYVSIDGKSYELLEINFNTNLVKTYYEYQTLADKTTHSQKAIELIKDKINKIYKDANVDNIEEVMSEEKRLLAFINDKNKEYEEHTLRSKDLIDGMLISVLGEDVFEKTLSKKTFIQRIELFKAIVQENEKLNSMIAK